jgi:hypothetical protein
LRWTSPLPQAVTQFFHKAHAEERCSRERAEAYHHQVAAWELSIAQQLTKAFPATSGKSPLFMGKSTINGDFP